jgi:hypothetical protein
MFRRFFGGAIAVASVVGVIACSQGNKSTSSGLTAPSPGSAAAITGNGAPSGPHYNLNLIGVPQDKSADMTGSGNRIFIHYEGQTDILLREGDYQVLDPNGTDGEASFQLPNPDGGDGNLAYSVWIRPVAGKGAISLSSCFTEFETNTTWCYAGSLTQNLTKSNKFTDVSRDLLQVCADTDTTAGTNLQLVPLFSDLGTDYFWHVDNQGMRNVQMRFYDLSTTPIGGDCTRSQHVPH